MHSLRSKPLAGCAANRCYLFYYGKAAPVAQPYNGTVPDAIIPVLFRFLDSRTEANVG